MADHADDNLPPAPAVRHITPAPEDFENPPAIRNLLWPLVWIALAGLCWKVVEAAGWVEWTGGQH